MDFGLRLFRKRLLLNLYVGITSSESGFKRGCINWIPVLDCQLCVCLMSTFRNSRRPYTGYFGEKTVPNASNVINLRVVIAEYCKVNCQHLAKYIVGRFLELHGEMENDGSSIMFHFHSGIIRTSKTLQYRHSARENSTEGYSISTAIAALC